MRSASSPNPRARSCYPKPWQTTTPMAKHTTTTDPNSSGDNYLPTTNEQSSTNGRIDALDYVSADHALLPPPRARSANSVMRIDSRFRYHAEFWWDVFLAMQERTYQDKNPNHYYILRAKLTRLRQENERLNQETGKLRKRSIVLELGL
jgi:hypothetical protein